VFIQVVPDFGPTSATPGLCYFCRSPRQQGDKGVLSTGVAVDMEGMVELCQKCVEEMGAAFGCLNVEKSDELRKKNREYGRRAQVAEDRLAKQDRITSLIRELAKDEG